MLDGGMKAKVVMTVLSADRRGIVSSLSEVIARHQGSWLESRMARLGGQFAGILRVECPASELPALVADLEGIEGLAIQAREQVEPQESGRNELILDVVGNDRTGIVRALSAAILGVGANIEDLHTALESAPMAGHPLFHAKGIVSLPGGLAPGDLIRAIEDLGSDLAVTVEGGD